MAEDVQIYELKKMDLKNAIVIDGFPSVGLVSSIVANFLITELRLEQIGILDAPNFPVVSLIKNSEPHHPVRIYAGSKLSSRGDGDKVVVFTSELQPPPNMVKLIAITMLDWIEEQRCSLLVSPEGLVIENGGPEERRGEMKVYGVGSTKKARELLVEPNVFPFTEGIITGIAGVLLNEGKIRDFDVICLLAEAYQDIPDARAAAKVIEVLDRILLHTKLDAKPLYDEALRIEKELQRIREKSKSTKSTAPPPTSSIYR
ncbi:MAG: proteasome assembly chaperone family protein [Thermoplasmata archaeon]